MTYIKNCFTDDDCYLLYECDAAGICQHKDLFPPNGYQILIYILIPIIISIANVGGIGGGVIKIPILILLLNYPQRTATYMAYCTGFGSVVPNVIQLIFQRHPNKNINRPIINFDISITLISAVLLGATIGYYMNVVLPDLYLILLFLVFLFIITPYLFRRAMDLWKTEIKEQQIELVNINNPRDNNNNNLNDQTIEKNEENKNQISERKNIISTFDKITIQEQNNEQLLQKMLNDESRRIPIMKIMIILSAFLLIQLVNFLRGDVGKSIIDVQRCTLTYWILTSMIAVISTLVLIIALFLLKKEEKLKQRVNYIYDKHDIQFTIKNFLKLMISGIAAGLLSGALGAGSGLATVPILLFLGVHPRVASATTQFNYLWVALTLIINVIKDDLLGFEEIIFFTSISMIGGSILAKLLYYFVNKYKKTSLVVFFVFGIAVINILGNFFFMFKVADDYGWNSLFEWPAFCPNEEEIEFDG